MHNKVILLDIENNMPTFKVLQDIIEHYPTVYLFNCTGHFEFPLDDLTELATWITSGQVVILDVPETTEKEYEYAVVVGQLLALLEPETQIEVISAMATADMLIDMLRSSDLSCNLTQVQSKNLSLSPSKHQVPSIETIKNKPALQLVKKYCDAVAKMTGKPNTVEKLKNSIVNCLQIVPEKAQRLLGMLINLKIVKKDDEQVWFRKKLLKQWSQLDLDRKDALQESKVLKVDDILEKLSSDAQQVIAEIKKQQNTDDSFTANFEKIDPVQWEVIQKLNELKTNKPKDIYALRDLLEKMFPQSDVRLLLKELIEKGYIYWNGHDVIYSHEMYLN
ncbi:MULTISPECIES: hypothetical protein [unclassified Acinetobacter]|uniref:hypothetical protein n=1 Tax=unclassified Acinetobacter TaxID=196816 RepID=UPI0025751ED0|nr:MULTISPECIES: hypothetical protein [unclassified Acinetobacter]MDM1763974.1 hypothetical protein [Acinetobacter sp. 226-1]MDM1767708.1 hypothetical protein [Acinetobacter sp. 226-4]